MKAVIFDMDGVLVETDDLFARFLSTFLLEKFGAPSLIDISQYRGVTSRDQWATLKKELNLQPSVDDLVSQARRDYLVYLESANIVAVKGILRLIQELIASRISIAIASSANPKRIDIFLGRLRLAEAFSVRVSADDVSKGKPAPDCFLLAAERLGAEPSECVVIEDAERGIRAAHAAHMKCVGYNGDPNNTDDLSAADLVIQNFDELSVRALHLL